MFVRDCEKYDQVLIDTGKGTLCMETFKSEDTTCVRVTWEVLLALKWSRGVFIPHV